MVNALFLFFRFEIILSHVFQAFSSLIYIYKLYLYVRCHVSYGK